MTIATTTWIAAAALATSLAANAVLGWAYLGQRDAATVAVGERDQARGAATACSDATEDLRTLADARKVEADKARAAAGKKAQTHDQKADEVLAAPATGANACESADNLTTKWLKGRK